MACSSATPSSKLQPGAPAPTWPRPPSPLLGQPASPKLAPSIAYQSTLTPPSSSSSTRTDPGGRGGLPRRAVAARGEGGREEVAMGVGSSGAGTGSCCRAPT